MAICCSRANMFVMCASLAKSKSVPKHGCGDWLAVVLAGREGWLAVVPAGRGGWLASCVGWTWGPAGCCAGQLWGWRSFGFGKNVNLCKKR